MTRNSTEARVLIDAQPRFRFRASDRRSACIQEISLVATCATAPASRLALCSLVLQAARQLLVRRGRLGAKSCTVICLWFYPHLMCAGARIDATLSGKPLCFVPRVRAGRQVSAAEGWPWHIAGACRCPTCEIHELGGQLICNRCIIKNRLHGDTEAH